MKMKASLVLMGLMISIIPMVAVALASGQVESSLLEKMAEERFEVGMGGPWIVSERKPGGSPFTYADFPDFRSALEVVEKDEIEVAKLGLDDLSLLGYVTIVSGNLTVSDPVLAGFTIPQSAGIYPIYGVIDPTEGLKALYIDLAQGDLEA